MTYFRSDHFIEGGSITRRTGLSVLPESSDVSFDTRFRDQDRGCRKNRRPIFIAPMPLPASDWQATLARPSVPTGSKWRGTGCSGLRTRISVGGLDGKDSAKPNRFLCCRNV